MNRILVDTNVVIDLLTKRAGFYEDAAKLFSLADKNKLKLTISTLTFANANYIIEKERSGKKTREILRKFKVLVELLSLNNKITELALGDESFPDFEDGLQYYSALENRVNTIVTRNKKDKLQATNFLSPCQCFIGCHQSMYLLVFRLNYSYLACCS